MEAKAQSHTEVMNGDTYMCHIWYDYVKGQKAVTRTRGHVKNPINLTLMS